MQASSKKSQSQQASFAVTRSYRATRIERELLSHVFALAQHGLVDDAELIGSCRGAEHRVEAAEPTEQRGQQSGRRCENSEAVA